MIRKDDCEGATVKLPPFLMIEDPQTKSGVIFVIIGVVVGTAVGGLSAGILAGVFAYAMYAIVLAVQEQVESQSNARSSKEDRESEALKRQLLGEDVSKPPTVYIEGNEIVGNDGAFASSLRFYPDTSCFILFDKLLAKPAMDFQTIGESEFIFNNKKELLEFIKTESLDFYGGDDEDWLSAILVYQFDSPERMYKNEFYQGKSTWSECEFVERAP